MFAASTRRHTQEPGKKHIATSKGRLNVVGAVFLILALLLVACSDDGDAIDPSESPVPTAATATTGSDTPRSRDLIELAQRFRGAGNLPVTVSLPEPELGDEVEFSVLMIPPSPEEEPRYRTLTALVAGVSDHAYFFVEAGADVDESDIDSAVLAFEEDIWPTVTGAFGLPPTPGVDGDERIAILHAELGEAVGGYVSQLDTHPVEVAPRSNQRETVYMDLRSPPGSANYIYILAHELQHLSHLALDPDESAWVNEGLSEFAARLVAGAGGSFGAFLDQPDTQLNAWDDAGGTARHYQASSLFFQYVAEQTVGDLGELAAFEENGVAGVDRFLQELDWPGSFPALVADWAAANFVDAPTGPYGYRELEVSAPVADGAEPDGEGEVHQFAADYVEVSADDFGEGATFQFEGSDTVPALAAQNDADGAFWWSGRGDNVDSMLTRQVDLTGATEATLTFRLWHDIERWYDYAYVAVSEDSGQTWTALSGRHTTIDDPVEVAYGPGYTGSSDGWVDEQIDLSAFAGSQIEIRFEYVTDTALQKPGFAIDDIAIPAIGFFDDGARDVGGWLREGFRILADPLDQEFELRLITLGSPPAVSPVPVIDGMAEIALPGLGVDYQRAVIAIVAVTDGTTEPAEYSYEVATSLDSS